MALPFDFLRDDDGPALALDASAKDAPSKLWDIFCEFYWAS